MAKDKSEMFVKISRSIEDNFLWHAVGVDHFDIRSAWIDLIIQANYKQGDFICGSSHVIVKRGQLITSLNHLAVRWHTTKKTVIRYLKLFEEEGMIYKESTNRYTTITIVNYALYQDVRNAKYTADSTAEYTSSSTPDSTAEYTQSKNIKNAKELRKNEKKEASPQGDY